MAIRPFSVSGKFFRADVVIVNAGLVDHSVQTLHHPRWTRNVVNRRLGVLQIPRKHLLVDQSSLAVPRPVRFLRLAHARDELVVGILLLQRP